MNFRPAPADSRLNRSANLSAYSYRTRATEAPAYKEKLSRENFCNKHHKQAENEFSSGPNAR
jgi:hypothetical protein